MVPGVMPGFPVSMCSAHEMRSKFLCVIIIMYL